MSGVKKNHRISGCSTVQKDSMMKRLLTAIVFLSIITRFSHEAGFETQPQSELEMTVRIDWKKTVPFPWKYNGGITGRIGDYIIYVGGFGRDVPDKLKEQPGYFDGYHRLFATYYVPTGRWEQAQPLFPGIARAYANYSVSNGRYAYILGGQSYVAPYCFSDAYRLSRAGQSWRWERLPDMLLATADFGCVLLDGMLYVQGGANYDLTGVNKGWDSELGNIGKHFEVLDLSQIDKGWHRLPEMPGTHRSHQAMAAVSGRIYVIGGIASIGGKEPKHRNTVDNWCYDPSEKQWTRIRDLPFPCGGWSSRVFQDRYILLFGGYYGREILDIDGSIRQPYGCDKAEFSKRVLVYDTQTNEFSEATPMPVAFNDTRLVWLDPHTVMSITGELPGGPRLQSTFVGRISLVPVRACQRQANE